MPHFNPRAQATKETKENFFHNNKSESSFFSVPFSELIFTFTFFFIDSAIIMLLCVIRLKERRRKTPKRRYINKSEIEIEWWKRAARKLARWPEHDRHKHDFWLQLFYHNKAEPKWMLTFYQRAAFRWAVASSLPKKPKKTSFLCDCPRARHEN